MALPFPLIRVKGSHYECGYQIGRKCKDYIDTVVNLSKNQPPQNLTWLECLEKSHRYFQYVTEAYPQVIEELRGVSKGAELKLPELFTTLVEELWDRNSTGSKQCTDIVITPPATPGSVFVGHNNDLSWDYQETIVAVERDLGNNTKILTIGPGGFYISVGINSFGICLTGNQLYQNDNKPGVPRSCIARAILNVRSFSEAVNVATDSLRASSYNNIITTANENNVVSVEGSGSDYALLRPVDGVLIHTNHYLDNKMKKFEMGDNLTSSEARYKSARRFLERRSSPFNAGDVLDLLSDHSDKKMGDDNTVCRHSKKQTTVFSFFANVSKGNVMVALGNPCKSDYFEIWNPTALSK